MVKWSFPATNDLKQIHDYIARDSRYYARKVVQDIITSSQSLKALPERGRIVPELSDPKIRELFVCSYRLIYEIGSEEIEILAVIHGKRNLSFIE